jgi:tellurite resistance protein TerC
LSQALFWVLFNAFVLGVLALDLWIFHRPAHLVKFNEAVAWSAGWIVMAAGFALLIYFWRGREPAMQFAAGYVIELSLSVDNLFIFLLIFRYFRVPAELQHKVLFWGILGALVMRGVFIFIGVGLIQRFHWVTYLFGVFLIYSGIKFLRAEDLSVDPEKNPVFRLFRRWVPITQDYVGERFFVRRNGLYATPLLAVLIILETTDILFATDSIPAVLAITINAFIVYTSTVFAVLSLRSMYFVLSGILQIFHYLHYGLSVVLVFIGAKMLAEDYLPISTSLALSVVAGVLLISVLASVLHPKQATRN